MDLKLISIPPPPGQPNKLPCKFQLIFRTPAERQQLLDQLAAGSGCGNCYHRPGPAPEHAVLSTLLHDLKTGTEPIAMKVSEEDRKEVRAWLYRNRLFDSNLHLLTIYEQLRHLGLP